MKYAIERIGYGKRTKYVIKRIENGLVTPVNGKAYKTEGDARKAAELLKIKIEVVGDIWEII